MAQREDRSLMNATFRIKNTALENKFLQECEHHGFIGIKGYRTVGGLRVSMYNALSISSVQSLCEMMINFNDKHK